MAGGVLGDQCTMERPPKHGGGGLHWTFLGSDWSWGSLRSFARCTHLDGPQVAITLAH